MLYTLTNKLVNLRSKLRQNDEFGISKWAKSYGGNSYTHGYSVVADQASDICITGTFSSISMDFGGDTLFKNGAYNMFVVKLDSNGNHLWSKTAQGSNLAVSANSVTVDENGAFYVAGNFYSPTVIFSNDTLNNFDTLHHNDIFIVKYSSSGTQVRTKRNGGFGNDMIMSIVCDEDGSLFASGYVGGIMLLDTISISNSSNIYPELYLGKLIFEEDITGYDGNDRFNQEILVYPNPTNGSFIIEVNETLFNRKLSIYDTKGLLVLESIVSGNKFRVRLENKGIYIMLIQFESNQTQQYKIVIQ